ncbi:hypothetical protein [Anatilimnocola aggregata]|nr:hypothetical protein [Anatilimnocola aggregata]
MARSIVQANATTIAPHHRRTPFVIRQSSFQVVHRAPSANKIAESDSEN